MKNMHSTRPRMLRGCHGTAFATPFPPTPHHQIHATFRIFVPSMKPLTAMALTPTTITPRLPHMNNFTRAIFVTFLRIFRLSHSAINIDYQQITPQLLIP